MQSACRLLACCSAIAALGLPLGAMAQQQADTQESSQSSGSQGLTEIVVTAQRRAERLQDVPISIVAVDSQQLADAHITDLAGVQQLAPAVRFDAQGPWSQVTIRGVGTSVVTTGSSASVGVYVDGFFVPNGASIDQQLLSVDSIQILKGPQGTLFGRNTNGGAILVNTLKPSEETSAIVDASYGSYGSQRYTLYGTTGLTDHVAVDVAALLSKGNGYDTNIVDDDDKVGQYDNWTIRTGLKVDFSDMFSVLFRYEHQNSQDPTQEEDGVYVYQNHPVTAQLGIPGAILATQPGQVADPGGVIYVGNHSSNNVYQITPTLDLGFSTLTSYSQFRSEDGTFGQNGITGSLALLADVVPVKDQTITQEFILTSKPGSRLQWTTGLYFFDWVDLFHANISIGGAPYISVTGSNTDTQSFAGYGDLTYQVLDDLYVTAGVRYTHDEVKDGYYITAFTDNRVYAPTLVGSKATPRVVVRYNTTENSNVYVSFAQGYKAGMFNLGGDSLTPVQPETINAYELGYKYAANALSVDLATYYYKYKNLQVPSYGLGPNNVPVGFVSNAANSRIYGLEGQVRYQLLRNFDINAGAAYLNAKYTSFPDAPGYAPCLTSAAACGANYGLSLPAIINASGYDMARSPRFTASAGGRYTMDFLRGRLAFSANAYYTSLFYEDLADELPQHAYATLGLRAEWTDPSGKLSLAVYGENVTDRRFYLQAYPENEAWPVTWNAPDEVFGEVKYRF
ncbi:MAG TPA: TonB-dependent receptor [Steroidobacteraceae bacterium]|nr:TonB-dependent receptor [Steroidobacteraceae bacterium]